ncbi:MAG: hypothetical protein HY542_05670 [Deltaproteobacteria bacterium]|nr:hypothetical protein [Deltaproteobacteria bacterium]
MAPLKLNIRPRLEEEMEELLPLSGARSKTDYINQAIDSFNRKIRRREELAKLRSYFKEYAEEAATMTEEFSSIRNVPHY